MSTSTRTQKRPKPKTAYELLQRVCAHILEEPQRYLQRRYVATGTDLDAYDLKPPCGTAACRAGWIVWLHDGEWPDYSCISSRANQILKMSGADTMDLFRASALMYENHGQRYKEGTRAAAEAGVRGLRDFMEQHAKHLKARLLKSVRRNRAKSKAHAS